MSTVYTLDPTNRVTGITIPSDGDAPIKVADVNPAFVGIGDLAANAIARVEPMADIVALAAIPTPSNGLTRYVLGYGLYTFQTAPPGLPDVSPFLVPSGDATPGRWVSHFTVMQPSVVTPILDTITPLASLAALAAIAAPTNNLTRYVLGYGTYTFKTASPLAGYISPRGVAATDATPGSWISHRALYDFEAATGVSIVAPPRDIIGISPLIAFNATRDALDEAGASAQITRYATGVAFTNPNTANTDARQLYFDITPRLLHGAYLASVVVGLAPVPHASVPTRPPRMFVFRHHLKTWTATQENLYTAGHYEDTGHANGAAYSAVHKFGGAMDQNHLIDKTNYAYTLCVVNEAGATSLGGLIITHFEFTHT